MEDKTVTLAEMLESKEHRASRQAELINKYKRPLVSFTVVMPGPIKQNNMSEKIFAKGKAEIEKALCGTKVLYKEEFSKKTGSEAFYIVDLAPLELKKLMIEAEEKSRIGRLFDIDVIGEKYLPVSRGECGFPERKCLICGGAAHACARSRKHSVDELLKEIERVLSDE
ncbi:MAG: citrate lyase holo-[Clostridia bacterium]|nr:citrate lyase holo-[acyl-carrier protein] synthase [Clostridia bacterium]